MAGAVGLGGDEAELEEVDIGAGEDEEHFFASVGGAGFGVEDGGETHGAGGFGDAAVAFPEGADGLADFCVGDEVEAVDGVLADFERVLAGLADSGAVAEDVDAVERGGVAGLDGVLHGVLVDAFDADDFDVWPVGF